MVRLNCKMIALRALVGVLFSFAMPTAQAAIRVCGEFIAVADEDANSETRAKQKALTGWISAASQLGQAFALWRNASEKSRSCMRLAQGLWRCQAYGRPCGVSQVPGSLPRGTPGPPVPDQPKMKGIQADMRHLPNMISQP